jgi:peroxiredoxin family protein
MHIGDEIMATITVPDISTVEQLSGEIRQLRTELDELRESQLPDDKLSIVVFSGDLDKLLAAFIIATGGAAMFEEVVMFFTFWATPALRDPKKTGKSKDLMGKMFARMLPKGTSALKLSKMNMGGLGTDMMKNLMLKKNILSLDDLIKTAADAGVKIYVCGMSMDLMGLALEDLIDYPGISLAGVAKFLQEAGTSKSSLFI